MNSFFINGCWEKSGGNDYRCRWFVSWVELDGGIFTGVLGGYSGHGSFELEKFVATVDNDEVKKFLFDFHDGISGDEIDFSAVCANYLSVCEDALDVVFVWNDSDVFELNDRLILKENKLSQCSSSGDLRFIFNRDLPYLARFCSLIGLTASP
jgi:hypothetical protein